MKVLMLGWEFPPHVSGGLGTACSGLVAGLGTQDVELTFVVPRLIDGQNEGGMDAGDARVVDCGLPSKKHRQVPVDAALLPYLTEDEYLRIAGRRGQSGTFGETLFDEVNRYADAVATNAGEDYDLVHAHDWMTVPAATEVARRLNVPMVFHVHSCEVDRAGAEANHRITAIEQAGLNDADRVVCVSRYTSDQLRTHYDVDPEKLRVVHNAVADNTDRPAPQQGKLLRGDLLRKSRLGDPIVLFLGRITTQKGPAYFLEAAARVVAELPRVKFVMAGSGDLLPEMIERAADLGLARHVHFTGFLRGADVDRMYDEASVYVLPSVSEPFGIAPLEALSRNVPVIVSKQSGVSEVLENVMTVDFWNVEDLANQILEVLRNPNDSAALAARGREEVERLTWDHQAAMVVDVYRETLAEEDGSGRRPSGPPA